VKRYRHVLEGRQELPARPDEVIEGPICNRARSLLRCVSQVL